MCLLEREIRNNNSDAEINFGEIGSIALRVSKEMQNFATS